MHFRNYLHDPDIIWSALVSLTSAFGILGVAYLLRGTLQLRRMSINFCLPSEQIALNLLRISDRDARADQEAQRGSTLTLGGQLMKGKPGRAAVISLSVIGLLALLAPLIANDKPLISFYKGRYLFPVLRDYPESRLIVQQRRRRDLRIAG